MANIQQQANAYLQWDQPILGFGWWWRGWRIDERV